MKRERPDAVTTREVGRTRIPDDQSQGQTGSTGEQLDTPEAAIGSCFLRAFDLGGTLAGTTLARCFLEEFGAGLQPDCWRGGCQK